MLFTANSKVKTITLTLSRNFSIICAATALTASMAATTTGDNKYLGLAGVAGNMSFLGLCIDTKNRNNDNKENNKTATTMKNVHVDANGQVYFRRTEGFGTIPDTSSDNVYYPKYTPAELALVQQYFDANSILESQRREDEEIDAAYNEIELQRDYNSFEQLTLF